MPAYRHHQRCVHPNTVRCAHCGASLAAGHPGGGEESEAAMKRTCLGYLLFFAAVGGVCGILLALLLPPFAPGHEAPFVAKLALALACGFAVSALLTLAAYILKDTLQRLRDRARLADRLVTMLPADGERVVACGTLVATGPLVTAPFTGTTCVSYWYQVKHTAGGSHSGDVIDAWGYSLTPSSVETPWGSVRLLSYTEFDFPAAPMTDAPPRLRAAEYFAATPRVPLGLDSLGTSIAAVKALMADDDGAVRGDFGGVGANFQEGPYRLYEKVVLDREPVCAFGTWAADRNGLLPDPTSAVFFPVHLRKGTSSEVRRSLVPGIVGNACAAAVLLALAALAVWAFFSHAEEFL